MSAIWSPCPALTRRALQCFMPEERVSLVLAAICLQRMYTSNVVCYHGVLITSYASDVALQLSAWWNVVESLNRSVRGQKMRSGGNLLLVYLKCF